jgi:hypothetical protein
MAAYKTVKFGAVLDRVFRARGFEPDQVTMTAKERWRHGEQITRWCRKAWEKAAWPQLFEYQQRTYRPPWSGTLNYSTGAQVYDETTEMYWTSLQDNNTGNTPPFTKVADTWWTPAVGMKRYIQLEQPWEVTAIDEDGVDVNAFAFYEDPLGNPGARTVIGCRRIQDCIMMPETLEIPAKVWCKFKPVAPRFALELWSGTTAYGAGELCYLESTRECYIATRATENESPIVTVEDGNPWAPVGFPEMFQDFTVLACTAENQTEDEGKYKTRALAEDELDDLVHKKTTKSGEAPRAWMGRRR